MDDGLMPLLGLEGHGSSGSRCCGNVEGKPRVSRAPIIEAST